MSIIRIVELNTLKFHEFLNSTKQHKIEFVEYPYRKNRLVLQQFLNSCYLTFLWFVLFCFDTNFFT